MEENFALLKSESHPINVEMRVLLFAIFIAFTLDASDPSTVTRLYYEGVDGNRDSAERASKLLETMNANDPRVMALRGSLLLLESSRAFAPWKKGKLAKEGLTFMDKAVELKPEDFEIRFIRAASTRDLPGFFKRGDESERDLAVLAGKVTAGFTEPRLASATLLFHAQNLEKRGDRDGAKNACAKAVSVAPGTPAAEKCRARYPSP